jgi:hypothetical protein
MIDRFLVLKSQLNDADKKISVCKARNTDRHTTGKIFKRTETLVQLTDKRNKVKEQMDKCQAAINNIEESSQSTGVVFATFKDCEAYEGFLNSFPQSALAKLFYKGLNILASRYGLFSESYKKKLNLISKLKVVEAPEPSDILWENLEYTDYSKAMRKLWVYLMSILLICISFVTIVGLNIIQNKFKEQSSRVNTLLALAVSQVIGLINFLLNKTLRKLSEFEKNDTQTSLQLTMGIKLTIVNITF